jgi:alpha-L-rhamnosidase
MKLLLLLASTATLLAPRASTSQGALTSVGLRVEYHERPLGLDEPAPRLSWRSESSARAQRQTAYRVLVASTPERLAKNEGDLWDSGKVDSAQSTQVVYRGKPLRSRQVCTWKVKTWDAKGEECAWSAPSSWTMGLLEPLDWKAELITHRDESALWKDGQALHLPPAHQFRREFTVRPGLRRATVYATALGIYELELNGARTDDAVFAPGWTDYHQRLDYRTYDVSDRLKEGPNALGVWLADGWYSGYVGFGLLIGLGTERTGRATYGKTPAVMVQLELEYADGSRDLVGTDTTWKVSGDGPIREADLLMGESYDARRETSGWSSAGFDDSSWQQALLAKDVAPIEATFYEDQNPPPGDGPSRQGHAIQLAPRLPPQLEAFPGSPVRATQTLDARALSEPSPGVWIFDLGQNFAGVARLSVKGQAGAEIQLRYGEMLHPDGKLMTENLRRARAIDHYILRGDPNGESYTPRFTCHGFRYVEVTGLPGKPELGAVQGVVLHSDTPLASRFECSDPMANRLFQNIVWTQRSNFVDLPTDCPQRDERLGWTGDAQAYVRTATYNADTAAFYSRWLRELMEAQRPSGTFPGYAPFPFQIGWDFGTAWCDAGVICPWTVWKAYDDTRAIERCWDSMVRFIEWRKSESKQGLGVAHGNDWGDWLAQGESTPLDYIDTIYFAYSTRLMAEMATALGKQAEAEEYQALFRRIQGAFAAKYMQADGHLAVDTQSAYALAIFVGLAEGRQREALGARLAEKIRANGYHMTTGFLGTRMLLPALTSVGQHDLAVRLFQSRDFPSWGYEIEQGATTIWERWNGYTVDKGFGGAQNAEMNSFSHYAFGAVGEWMFQSLAGIDSVGPGFQRVLLRAGPPRPGTNPDRAPIEWVSAEHDSHLGTIESSWRVENGRLRWLVRLPANTSAEVWIPARSADQIRESDRPLAEVEGAVFLRQEGERAVLDVGSGQYRFEVPWPPSN